MLVEVILDKGKHPLLILFHLTYDKLKGVTIKGEFPLFSLTKNNNEGDLDILEAVILEVLISIRSIYSSKL